jgi:hypothetical protein
MVCVRFQTPRGTGKSYYEVCIKSGDFAALAASMIRASPEKAIKAFGEALRGGPPEQIEKTHWTPDIR